MTEDARKDKQQSDFWTDALARKRFRQYVPNELAEQAVLYFNWCNDNPLWETDIRTADGVVATTPVAKVRAFTLRGFLLWLGMPQSTWITYVNDPLYTDVCQLIDNVIYTQKFENAAAGLLNSNIIARDLGLAEKQDLSSSDGSMTPKAAIEIDFSKMTDKGLEDFIRATNQHDNDGPT